MQGVVFRGQSPPLPEMIPDSFMPKSMCVDYSGWRSRSYRSTSLGGGCWHHDRGTKEEMKVTEAELGGAGQSPPRAYIQGFPAPHPPTHDSMATPSPGTVPFVSSSQELTLLLRSLGAIWVLQGGDAHSHQHKQTRSNAPHFLPAGQGSEQPDKEPMLHFSLG